MNLIRQLLAVFLSFFLSFSALAADSKKETKKKDGAYPYFKLGIRSVNSSGFVDWGRECVVVTTEDSLPVRLYYRSSSGSIKLSAPGIIRAPEDIIVSAKTGFALRPKICGNGLGDPTNWIPVGNAPKCSEEPAAAVVEEKPTPANEADKATTPPPDMYKSFTIPDPEYKWGLKLEEPKRLDLDLAKPDDYKALLAEVARQNKRTRTTLYIVGGVVVAAVVTVLICSSKRSSKKSTGGPAGDPINFVYVVYAPR